MKKKNPQDSTMRNVRAANEKIKKLTARVARLEKKFDKFLRWLK